MSLDIPTLLAMVFLNAFAMAAGLTVASDDRKSVGVAAWVWGAWMQAIGWGCLIAGYRANAFWLLSCGAVSFCVSLSLAHQSIRSFVGLAGTPPWLFMMPVFIAIVHPIAYITEHPHIRIAAVAIAAFLQSFFILSTILCSPKVSTQGWRWLVVFTMGSTACVALLKTVGIWFSPNPTMESVDVTNTISLVVAVICVNLNSLALLVAQRAHAQRKLEVLATTDSLTGLMNRRSLIEFGEQKFRQASESGSPLTVVMIDLDFFKAINDNYGHLTGDKVLVGFAALLRLNVQAPDLVGRFGGEEFCIIMPNSGLEAALSVDHRVRESFSRLRFDNLEFQPTYSAGATQAMRIDQFFSGLLGRADALLYKAKQSGRARMVTFDANDGEVLYTD